MFKPPLRQSHDILSMDVHMKYMMPERGRRIGVAISPLGAGTRRGPVPMGLRWGGILTHGWAEAGPRLCSPVGKNSTPPQPHRDGSTSGTRPQRGNCHPYPPPSFGHHIFHVYIHAKNIVTLPKGRLEHVPRQCLQSHSQGKLLTFEHAHTEAEMTIAICLG